MNNILSKRTAEGNINFLLSNIDGLCGVAALSAYNAAAATVTTDKVLSISITGRVQPYLINPSDLRSGINYLTDLRENNIPDTTVTILSDTGALTVDNPEDGIYTLYLKGINNEDFEISLSYMDSASGEEESYTGFNHSKWSSSSSANWNPDADLDNDGFVGLNDYTIFGGLWWTS